MAKKIIVLNCGGSSGVSTIVHTIIAPRLSNATLININVGINAIELFGKFDIVDAFIAKVKHNAFEEFIDLLKRVKGSAEDFDLFIIPTTPMQTTQKRAITTVKILLELGVEPEKIKIIFNQFDCSRSIAKQYPVIFRRSLALILGLDRHDKLAVIEKTQLFDVLQNAGLDYIEALNDMRDFNTLISSASVKIEKETLSAEKLAVRMVKSSVNEFDVAFKNLTTIHKPL